MNWMRSIRHFWIGPMHVRKTLSATSLSRITQAITESELTHCGEIRFVVEGSLPIISLLTGVTARQRAVEVFSQLRIWDTEGNNGVLIYLLLADRNVEILADRGVHAKVGAEGWEDICQKMEVNFRHGYFESGIINGIRAVGRNLESYYPRMAKGDNELPDSPVIL